MTAWLAPQEMHDLAFRYALSVDNCDATTLMTVFTPDGVVRGYGENPIHFSGSDGLATMISMVKSSFQRTMHKVFNQTFERGADGTVTGLTYCIASHVLPGEPWQLLDMALRYHNVYAHTDGGWKFADRALEVLWTETRSIEPFTPAIMSSEFNDFASES